MASSETVSRAYYTARAHVLAPLHASAVRQQRSSGRVEFRPWMANGLPYHALSEKQKFGIAVGRVHFHLFVTSTYEGFPGDGVHALDSWHYKKRAVDMARFGKQRLMGAFQRYLARHHSKALEIFGPATFYIKNGQRIPGAFPDHQDHVHWAQ